MRAPGRPAPAVAIGIGALVAFIGCVFGANWFVENVGAASGPGGPHTLPVGFGLRAPSGFVMVGASLTARDLLQRFLGPRWTVAAIVAGAALSWAIVDREIAVASGVTFLIAEALDFGVYTPLQSRQLTVAVVGSNVVGAVADSVLFLWLAFGFGAIGDFALAQTLGKVEWSLLFLPVLWAARRWAETVEGRTGR